MKAVLSMFFLFVAVRAPAEQAYVAQLLPPPEKEISFLFPQHNAVSARVHERTLQMASPQELLKAETFWRGVFPGTKPNDQDWAPDFSTPNFDLRNLRGGDVCADDLKKIYSLTAQYNQAALHRGESAAPSEDLLREIRTHLFSTLPKERPLCFAPAVATYALASFGRDQSEAYRLLVALLHNVGRLTILTPEKRCQLGGVWNVLKDASQSSEYEIVGGYSCGQSILGIDPRLAPFDLRASLIHELDHLLRDKLVSSESLHLDARSYTVLDEALSAVHGGLSQIQTLWRAKSERPTEPPEGDMSFFDYSSGGQPDLQRGAGNLLGAWMQWMPRTENSRNSFHLSFLDFPMSWHFSLTFLNQNNIASEDLAFIVPDGRESLDYQLRRRKSILFQNKTFARIAEQYGIPVDQNFFEKVRAQIQNSGTALSPLLDWVSLAQAHSQPYESEHRRWMQYLYYNLWLRLNLPSKACTEFLAAAERGDLSGYIGTDAGIGKAQAICRGGSHSRTDVRPGGESVRPTLKPCLKIGI